MIVLAKTMIDFTEKENELFIAAVRLYGKHFRRIREHMKTNRKRPSINSYYDYLVKKFQKNPDHPDADLLPVLQGKDRDPPRIKNCS